MAKKDFWFPFLFEKFLASTNGWEDDQVGAYLRLLIYQFQNGSIPKSIKKIGRISTGAKKHWDLISPKFKDDGNGGLYNDVMAGIRESRMKVYEANSVNGSKGGRPKKNGTETETDRLTETERHINININKEENTREGIAFDMLETFKSRFQNYWTDQEKDLPAVMQIANKIANKHSWTKDSIVHEHRKDVVTKWSEIVDFAASDKWFSTRAISDLNREWQRLMQSFKVPEKLINNAENKPKYSAREQEGREILGLD